MGDPGIEPGMGLPGGVTVRCRTLQHVARRCAEIAKAKNGVNRKIRDSFRCRVAATRDSTRVADMCLLHMRTICILLDFLASESHIAT